VPRIRREFHDPEGERYGLPTYWWRGAPAGYATRRQLRELGLRPGGQPIAAQVLWQGTGGVRAAYLYRMELAKPRQPASPAKLEAIGRALAARRTCPRCHEERDYYIPRRYGECLDCVPEVSPVPVRAAERSRAGDRKADEGVAGGAAASAGTSEALASVQRAREALAARQATRGGAAPDDGVEPIGARRGGNDDLGVGA
jgi:hypothetical protein